MRENKSTYDLEYAKSLDKKNNTPYFESSFPTKKTNNLFTTILVVIAFSVVFFVIAFCIVTAINYESTDTITITLNYYDDVTDTKILKKGEVLLIPSNVSREGYKFVGWYSDPDFKTLFNTTEKLKDNATIYAKWDIESYTIRFNVGSKTFTVNYGQQFEIPSNTTFGNENIKGWTTVNGSNVVQYKSGDKLTMPAHDVVLYVIV